MFKLLQLAACAMLLAPVAASAQEAARDSFQLNLMCVGSGNANKFTTVNAFNSDGDSAMATISGNRIAFNDQVNVSISGQESRVRMPPAMLPPIKGGENGWFKVNSVVVGENEITGSISVNPVNNPKLRIDRITGTISISGKAGDFNGRCSAYDPKSVQRAF